MTKLRRMRPTKHEIRQALASLIEKGLVVDSGLRRNGQIVWVAVSEKRTEDCNLGCN